MPRGGVTGSLNLGSVDVWGWVIWGSEGPSGVPQGVEQPGFARCQMSFLPR